MTDPVGNYVTGDTPRRQTRAVTVRAAVLGVVVVAAVLGAAPAGADSTAVGGPLLAGSGLVLPASGPALPPGLVAASWLVADLNTGQVLGARAPHAPHAPASTLKILTAESSIPSNCSGRASRLTVTGSG